MGTGKQYGAKILSGRSSQAVAASTAVDFNGNETAAVMVSASGNLIGTLVNDDAPQTFVVVQGMMYPLAFRSIDVSNAVAIVAVFN